MRELTQEKLVHLPLKFGGALVPSSLPSLRAGFGTSHRRLYLIEQAPALGEPTLPGGGDLKAASAPPTSQSRLTLAPL